MLSHSGLAALQNPDRPSPCGGAVRPLGAWFEPAAGGGLYRVHCYLCARCDKILFAAPGCLSQRPVPLCTFPRPRRPRP